MADRQEKKQMRIRLLPGIRQEQIVQTAHDILTREGYAALSYSRIAKQCAIRLSTVQHHFPERSLLIEAVLNRLLDELLERYTSAAATMNGDPAEHLEVMIRLLAADVDNAEIASLFFELWAFSQRDPVMAEAMERVYAHVRTHLSELVLIAVPGLTKVESHRRAIMVMAMADGLTVTLGHKPILTQSVGPADREAIVTRLVRLALEG
ncbi:TetR/AcrR family transcriptional regulator [Sphingomonas koreensis]